MADPKNPKEPKFHKLKVYSSEPNQVSKGSNTKVELDGNPVKGVSFLKVEFDARKVTKVTMDLYVSEIAIDDVLFAHTPELDQLQDGKYTISKSDKVAELAIQEIKRNYPESIRSCLVWEVVRKNAKVSEEYWKLHERRSSMPPEIARRLNESTEVESFETPDGRKFYKALSK